MTLDRILAELDPRAVGVAWTKPGDRRSRRQAHVWIGVQDGLARWVLKFSEPREGSTHAAAAGIERELRFLQAVDGLPDDDPLRVNLPRLRGEGSMDGRRWIAMAHDPRPFVHRDLHPRFARRPEALGSWLGGALDLLARLQEHQWLLSALDLAPGEFLLHGDFNPYNLLGEGPPLLVVDWEDWHAGTRRYLDALHCLTVPCLHGRSLQGRAASFGRLWLRDNEWLRRLRPRLEPFLGGRPLAQALSDYLRHQEERLGRAAPDQARMFELCRLEITRAPGAQLP